MSYDLVASRPRPGTAAGFRFGMFSWPILLEQCGTLFPLIQRTGQWFCVFDEKRMGKDYPRLISNDGFRVTADEARIMARMARNYVKIQRALSDDHRLAEDPAAARPWPLKIRGDFADKFEAFAEWAEKSGGFKIW